jgi:hypothetical protein
LCWLKRLSALRKLIIMLGFGPKGFYDDLTSSVRFHRILRRGREYGSELSPEQTLEPAPENGQPRGLNFICLMRTSRANSSSCKTHGL